MKTPNDKKTKKLGKVLENISRQYSNIKNVMTNTKLLILVYLAVFFILFYVHKNNFFTDAKATVKRKYILLKTCDKLRDCANIDKWNKVVIPDKTKQEPYIIEINEVTKKIDKGKEIKKGNDIISVCVTDKDEKVVVTFSCGEILNDPVLIDCDGPCNDLHEISISIINKTRQHHKKHHPK